METQNKTLQAQVIRSNFNKAIDTTYSLKSWLEELSPRMINKPDNTTMAMLDELQNKLIETLNFYYSL